MSKIREGVIEYADIYKADICYYDSGMKQWLVNVLVLYPDGGKQGLFVEIFRLGEFMEFLNIKKFSQIADVDKKYLIEQGRKRIKSIVKPADNELGYEKFRINKVFIGGGLDSDFPKKNGGTKCLKRNK